ncbi:MAG TPA: hypothetical protein VMY05_06985 [Acidobacteriota bacterium]|nr:hypothetical protein [Acidobacteriota bacterium]
MTDTPASPERQYAAVRLLAVVMLVGLPTVCLLLGILLSPDSLAGDGVNEFVVYVLLIVGATGPAIVPVIQRWGLNRKGRPSTPVSASALFVSVYVLKMAAIEAVYVYGLVVFLLSGEFEKMAYFYPVGIVWTVVSWPNRGKFDRFLKTCEAV